MGVSLRQAGDNLFLMLELTKTIVIMMCYLGYAVITVGVHYQRVTADHTLYDMSFDTYG